MHFARAGAAFGITALTVVAGLAWAGWPRPAVRAVVPGAAATADLHVHEPDRLGVVWNGGPVPAHPRWVVLSQYTAAQQFWVFDRTAGVVRGPWQPPHDGFSFCHDPAGHMVTRPASGFVTCLGVPREAEAVHRIDPATGAVARTVGPVPQGDALILSTDGSTAAVVVARHADAEDAGPLTVRVIDTADGRVRRRFNFPARVGLLGVGAEESAAADLQLSPDGRRLAVADAWAGLELHCPGGVDVYDTHTGALVRQVAHPDPPPAILDTPAARQLEHAIRNAAAAGEPFPEVGIASGSAGAFQLRFDAAGRSLAYSLRRQVRGFDDDILAPAAVGAECGVDLATGDSLPAGHLLLALPRGIDADPVVTSADGCRTLIVNPARAAVRVTTPEGPTGPWHPVPAELAARFGDEILLPAIVGDARFVPGTDKVVFHYWEQTFAESGWWADVRSWLGLSVRRDGHDNTFLLYDAVTGEFDTLFTTSENPNWLVMPGEVAFTSWGGNTIEVWPARGRREPWPWAVPAGLFAGTFAAWLAGRHRKPVKTPTPASP